MPESLETGHCFFLIPSQPDPVVYQCFRNIAQRWPKQVTHQYLSIESDLPFTPGLTANMPPSGVKRILAANADLITQLEVTFGGLTVCYLRSGGHGPSVYRQSYFDEVRLECNGLTTIGQDELRELAEILCDELDAQAASGTTEFAALAEALPLRVRSFSPQNRA